MFTTFLEVVQTWGWGKRARMALTLVRKYLKKKVTHFRLIENLKMCFLHVKPEPPNISASRLGKTDVASFIKERSCSKQPSRRMKGSCGSIISESWAPERRHREPPPYHYALRHYLPSPHGFHPIILSEFLRIF